MGIYESMQKIGKVGGGKGTSGGFSASRYYSRNAMSATSHLPPAPSTSSADQPLDVRRPYSNVGKMTVNLMGRPVTAKSQELQGKPGAFQGVPILGNIAGAIGALGTVPLPLEAIPGIGPMIAMQRKAAADMAREHGFEYTDWAAAEAKRQGLPDQNNWFENTRMMVDFARMQTVKDHRISELGAAMAFSPYDDNIGGLTAAAIGGLSNLTYSSQRLLAGAQFGPVGGTRVEDLLTRTDEQLEDNEDLIKIRDDFRAGNITRDTALDRLTLEGHAITDPFGQSGPIRTIRSIGDNTPFELVGDLAANIIAAGASLGLDLATDITTYTPFVVGKAAAITAKGSAKVIVQVGKVAAREAVKEAAERGIISAAEAAAEAGAKSAAVKEIENTAIAAAERQLYSNLPEGVAATDMNVVKYGLKANDAAVREAMRATSLVERPFVANQHVLKWMQMVEIALDPLTLFGGDKLGRMANKAVGVHIVNGGTDALGKRQIGRVMSALEKAGISQERSGGHLGTGLANIGQQIGGEQVARSHLKLGIGADSLDEVALTNLGMDMLSRHGKDVATMTKHKVSKVVLQIQPRQGEKMADAVKRVRVETADDLVKMYGISIEAALDATKNMGERELGVVHFMRYGSMADDLISARSKSISDGLAKGLTPDFINRIIFLGPTQLTRAKADELRKLLKAKKFAEARDMVEQYDLLEWNISLSQVDKDLKTSIERLLETHYDQLPTSIEPAKLTPAMREFKAKYGDSVELGLRHEDLFSVGRNADGQIVSADPFMDYIRAGQIGMGDVMPENILRQHLHRLTQKISGSQIVIEQNRRFAQRMAEQFGMTREQSDAVMSVVRAAANTVKVASARGMEADELYEAAKVAIPRHLKDTVHSRDVQLAIFFAHEGSLGKVGLTQKFTGMAKRAEVKFIGSNVAGTISERYYPMVRFKWNLFFQLQEGIETPVLLVARGMVSPGQFAGPFTGTARGVKTAIREGGGVMQRAQAFRRGKALRAAEIRNAEFETAVMMDAFRGGVRYNGDMIEATNLIRAGGAAAGAMSSSEPGRALTALLTDTKVARIKTRGQLLAFRSSVGDDMARMMKAESPVSWATARAFYNDGAKLSDGEVAVRWFNDLLARNNPDSAFDAVLAHQGRFPEPGHFFRPSFVGRQTRWSEKVVMFALRGEMDEKYSKMSFRQLRQRYLNPNDTVITEEWLERRLRAMGADETYIERTKWRMDYPDEKTWENFVGKELLGGNMEAAAAHMDYHRAIARMEGIPLIESLADKYSGHPQVLDEHGEWKETTLFQLIADATEARGLETLPANHIHVAVGGTMSQIGAPHMPDIGLPESVAELSWEGHALAPHTELVPLSALKGIKVGNELRMTEAELKTLARDIKSRGMQEPIQLTYSVADRTVVVGEGNHRIAGLIQLLNDDPKKLAGYNAPVTVFRQNAPNPPGGTVVRGLDADEFGYVPANLRPSDVGIGDAESAAIRRHEASARKTSAVKELTPGQKKGREYQQARIQRAARPELGTPDSISGVAGGRLVAKNADGVVTHRIGGRKSMDEWVGELRANMTDEEMAEHAGWYVDMRRGFMALNDNDQHLATQLLMAFGVTQMNTSPVDGMKFMLNVVESLKAGKGLPDEAKALTKVAGLNGVNLKNLMETGYVSEAGMGQKLIDFVDSLIGVNGRTVPVRGPNGTWTAAAGDVWAKRDVGFVDQKMLNHLKAAYGDQYDITKVNNTTFRFFDRETNESFTVPAGNSQPSSLEYDHIVEFYNDAADHLNTLDNGKGFLGRNDWVAAEAQALGWFKAKKVYRDPTGDPRTAFFDSVYQTRVDALPSRNAVMDRMYPSLAEDTSNNIAGRIGSQVSDEAARLSGVHVITSHGSVVRWPDGRLGSATNFEVMASPTGIRHHLAILASLGHQSRVRATRSTATRPTSANGVRHMVELSFPPSMPKSEMDAIHKALSEGVGGRGDINFFGDSDLIVRPDGSYAVRVVANKGESLTAFTKRMDDVQLREWHTQVYGEDGFARGRYVNPDEPMGTGARKVAMQKRGQGVIDGSLRDPKPITWADDNIEDLVDELWKSVQPDVNGGWGGLTVDLHNGSRPKAYGDKKGGGPFATGITPKGGTISLSLDVGEEEFKQAVRDFINANRGDLQRPNAHLGVFRDIDAKHNRIDIDTNLLVDSYDDVEAVQLVLEREGGAYDFSSGNGVYSPHFDPARANDVDRGFAEVIEMENDWATNPNGEGYTQHLGGDEYGTRVRGHLEREGVQWGRMVREEAYQRVASRETAAHRAARASAGDADFDVGNPAGYFQSHPRGTRAAVAALGDSSRGSRRLYQRTSRGAAPSGAITDPGRALSTSAPGRPVRAQVYINPKRRLDDTLAHEEAHDFINRYLHPSGLRRAKAAYAGREGALPQLGAKSRSHVLTTDEQEYLADQLVEYLRQGPKAMKNPALEPLAAYYSKVLKDKKRRVEPDLTQYTAEELMHREAMSAYEARRVAHETERARQLAPVEEVAPPVAAVPAAGAGLDEVTAQANAIRAMHTKWDNAGARNGPRMENDLVSLEQQGIDVTDELNLLDEYRSMERGDFDDAEEFSQARSDTWDDLLDSLDSKAENHIADNPPEEAIEMAAAPAAPVAPPRTPVDIGEFTEAAPVAPVRPSATSVPVTLDPETKALFDSIDKSTVGKNPYGFDVDEENAIKWMYAAHRRADQTSKDLVHFKGDRSWLERSLNHPYFGLYPLSYMWGKVLPEMVEFLMARPFGLKTPLVAFQLTNKMYQHTMNAIENDDELRAFMAENEDALRAISMLVPGVPWDLPVNSPLWVRRYVEGVATNLQKDMDGEQPEGYNAWNAFISDIDYQRMIGDTLSYTAGPARGAETLLSYPGLIGKTVGALQGENVRATEEEINANPDFNPPVTSHVSIPQQLQQVQQGVPAQQPTRPREQPASDVSPDTVEELQNTLGDEYENVVERIGGGG